MLRKNIRSRLLALALALTTVFSMAGAARAITLEEAKASLATVDITQVYNGKETDSGVHNYAVSGESVNITYSAKLQMTEEMALYLLPRQKNLMNAKFNIHVDMDTDVLEFASAGSTVTVRLSSTFLKPWVPTAAQLSSIPAQYRDALADSYDPSRYSSKLVSYDKGVFTYEVSVDRAWAVQQATFDIPMELISHYDGTTAYGYEEAKAACPDAALLYADFTKDDWMHPVVATLADMKVKQGVSAKVTFAPSTWIDVYADGTVDGIFTYATDPVDKVGSFQTFEDLGYINTLEFGDDDDIEEWKSNRVLVRLTRYDGTLPPTIAPESPYLNLYDHFAYVVGYPDGKVHPEWTITRAEVATIFFRMLTDEVRNEYWCKTNPYNDVKPTSWYNNAISTLTNMGIINGYSDGGFHPNANITRAEFATMAVRFFTETEEMKWGEDAFTDIDGHWANRYINLAYMLQLVSGYPDGSFHPQQDITRAEAMTLVNNTLRRSPCVEGIEPVEHHEDYITWPDNQRKTAWYYAEVQEATNSHDYTYFNDVTNANELWLDILPVRDWVAFERAWSDANAATNPGEVVGHD